MFAKSKNQFKQVGQKIRSGQKTSVERTALNYVELILRFCDHAIGVLADFESMFMQIAIRKDDQSALRFVWLEDNLIRQYQNIRLIFGANCSPCCAIFVLRKCAADHSTQFSEVDQAVRKNFYMDDLIKSCPNASEARRLTEDLRNVLMRGGFRLTKFLSNKVSNEDGPSELQGNRQKKLKRPKRRNGTAILFYLPVQDAAGSNRTKTRRSYS